MKNNNALYLKIRDNGWRDIIYPMLNYKKGIHLLIGLKKI